MTRTLTSLAALAIVALMSAACSQAPSGAGAGTHNSAASAGADNGAASPGSSGAGNSATNTGQGVKFAECMRGNGISSFPDPDASGQLTVDAVLNGSSLDPNSPAWKQAISACKDLQPAGFTGHKRSAQQQKAALNFATCMRGNGVNDFPDPSEDGPLIDTTRIPSLAGKVPRTDPGLNAAMRKCGGLAAGAMGK